MAEQDKQEGQKTVVSFVVGLLIGGLLVWAFSGPAKSDQPTDSTDRPAVTDSNEPTETSETTSEGGESGEASVERPTLPVGDGRISVNNQAASNRVALASAVYPISEGWIGVREYTDGQLGHLLGVVRFSEEQGLVPSEIVLQRSTTAGRSYAVVVYTDDGDRQFNLANDAMVDQIFATFSAQ